MFSHWISSVFSHPSWAGLLVIAAKTAVIYFFLVGGLRLLGKRELGQMTIYDLVLIIILANAVQNAMVGDDNTLAGGVVAALTLLLLNRLLTIAFAGSRRFSALMVGEPTLIVSEGHIVENHTRKEGISREQILAALREHGLEQLEQARMCVLEVDGTISVVPAASGVYRTRHHFRALRLP